MSIEDIPIDKIRDVYPEMVEYLKHIRKLCGGDNDFFLRYSDDPMFRALVDIHETATRAVLTHYKLECGQVIAPIINVPLEELLERYISTLKSQIGSIKRGRIQINDKEKIELIELELKAATLLVELNVDELPSGIEHPIEYIMSVRVAVNYIRDAVLDILMYGGDDDFFASTFNSWDNIDKVICRVITEKLKLEGKPVTKLPP